MGTGSGINAILAASSASEVVGVDVNPLAVATARQNASVNGVEGQTTFLEGDLFDPVAGAFDVIIFDPPFRWLRPRDMTERSIADEGYRTLTRFMREAPSYLSERGRMLMFFGTTGDLGYLRQLISQNGFQTEVVGSRDLERDGAVVSYFAFRLIHRGSTAEQINGG
jgi:release factor glutamine methyltransferase